MPALSTKETTELRRQQQPGILCGQPGVAPVQQPNTQMFTTVVPRSHGPGMQVPVNVSGQQFMVPVTPGFGPGVQFQFRVPRGEISRSLYTQTTKMIPIPHGGPVPGQHGAPAPQCGVPGHMQQFGAPPPQCGAPGQVQQHGAPSPQQASSSRGASKASTNSVARHINYLTESHACRFPKADLCLVQTQPSKGPSRHLNSPAPPLRLASKVAPQKPKVRSYAAPSQAAARAIHNSKSLSASASTFIGGGP